MSLPLKGKTLVITRAKDQAQAMAKMIEERGGNPLLFPLIRTLPSANIEDINQSIRHLEQYDWVLFTSQNGVRYFLKRAEQIGLGKRTIETLKQMRVVVVGTKTAQVLQHYEIQPDFIPTRMQQEGLRDEWLTSIHTGTTVLFPRGNLARPMLANAIRQSGVAIDEVIVYETVRANPKVDAFIQALQQQKIDMITFSSPSAVQFFYEWLQDQADQNQLYTLLKDIDLACIGAVTEKRMNQLGFTTNVSANPSTMEGLLESIEDYYKQRMG